VLCSSRNSNELPAFCAGLLHELEATGVTWMTELLNALPTAAA
jgi:hypothetical protein